jgi:cobalt-zinc-cadmium efflux system membrane fusion protein
MTEPKPSRLAGTFFAFVFRSIPVLLVLAAAGTIGWYGHTHEWKPPKLSELMGHAKEEDDWCGDHGVPKSECVECDPNLMPRLEQRGWCKIHGIAECTLCNPELAQLATKPTITAADLERAQRSLDFADRPENNLKCRLHERRLQFATAEAAEKAGIKLETVWTTAALEFVSAPGELGYDPTRLVHLSARSPGSIWKVFKHLGQEVKAGDVLALIDAAEVGKAKAELLQAYGSLQLKLQTLESIKDSSGAVPGARIREGEAAVREADIRLNAGCQTLTNLGLPLEEATVRTLTAEELKAKLHLLGIPTDAARSLDTKTATTNLLPIIAPIDGLIVSREIVAGEVVDISRILFEVVDTRYLWLTLDLKGDDALRVKVGQTVRFKPDAASTGRQPPPIETAITWKSSLVDPKTRTVKIRAEVADPESKQLANTFGSGRVILREEAEVVSVPNEAIQWEGCCHIVFVQDKNYAKEDSPKVFHVRKVRLGSKDDKNTEIIAGVLKGEQVVVTGSGILLTELRRGDLGEGCACHPKGKKD